MIDFGKPYGERFIIPAVILLLIMFIGSAFFEREIYSMREIWAVVRKRMAWILIIVLVILTVLFK